ncbi:MAG: dTMP kinase [Thermoplasmata archaeon]|nr:dTMP kinase [Thermoplasmata archaeon]
MRGTFIVIEGIDGSGKTTLAKRLAGSRDVWLTAEPTKGRLGSMLRSGELGDIPPAAEALLFAADRSIHTAEIESELEKGRWVICDRYAGSTVAYQSASMGDSADWDWLNSMQAHSVIRPDAVILLDMDPEESMARVGSRGEELSRFEKLDFQRRVRTAYLRLAEQFGYIVIDASKGADEVFADAVNALKQRGIDASE